MKIHGLQKMTLLDFPGRIACTVFLGGCDFRCPFCHNAELLDAGAPALMESEELLQFLKGKIGLLDGVAITGGEPLLRQELPELLREIKALGFLVKLDTNGSQPGRLRALFEEKLVDYVAMDIKNSPERYALTTGLPSVNLTAIQESIALILHSGIEYEFRTTVVAELHDDSSFYGIRDMITGAEKYFLQPFVDRDTVPFGGLHAPTAEDLTRWLEILRPALKHAAIRGQ